MVRTSGRGFGIGREREIERENVRGLFVVGTIWLKNTQIYIITMILMDIKIYEMWVQINIKALTSIKYVRTAQGPNTFILAQLLGVKSILEY